MIEYDDDGFPVLGPDEEIVLAEPPPPPPPPKTYVQRWAEIGIPHDIRFAKKRLTMDRQRRRQQKKKIMVQHSTKITAETSDALYEICDRYDVSMMKVMQKFIEDGIRNLAKDQNWPELLEKAGLEERKPNPFDPIQGQPPPKETWTAPPADTFVPPELPTGEFIPLPAGVGPQVNQ